MEKWTSKVEFRLIDFHFSKVVCIQTTDLNVVTLRQSWRLPCKLYWFTAFHSAIDEYRSCKSTLNVPLQDTQVPLLNTPA